MNFLLVQSSSKFSCVYDTFSKRIVVLEELTNTDSVSQAVLSYFLHKWLNALSSREINVASSVSRLSTSVSFVNGVSKNTAVIKESKVFNVSEFVSINIDSSCNIIVINCNTEESDGLLELFW